MMMEMVGFESGDGERVMLGCWDRIEREEKGGVRHLEGVSPARTRIGPLLMVPYLFN